MIAQRREIVLNHVPDDVVVDHVVAVDEDVSKRDDARCFRDAGSDRRIDLGEAADGFPDDFKLAFDGAAEQLARVVVSEGLAGGELHYQLGGLTDVFQALLRFKLH